ncbi:toxin Cry1Ac domain D-VI-related protein [Paenilisteria newyorkensis]|uniref:toxin Cry1Ac domain D-VI-related protein n=1 Tax=Listeria newyorkensis TaxID=1497681 RepID=UPI00235957D5|nr:toxin Cry1Ac domain D-VI-related protein [Listeria newyorkensis]WAO22460.2 toxin Cry1Ac domain D-VI-related protein [Listeria newyorkensis]
MKNKKVKKLVSVLTIATVLGTSVVTPLNTMATPTQAATSATAPKYVAPGYTTLYMSNINAYFPSASLDGNYLVIDMIKIHKGYGIDVLFPNGQKIQVYKQLASNVAETARIYVGNTNLQSAPYRVFYVDKINPNGTSYLSGKYSFQVDTSRFYKYDTNFGQAVYNLFTSSSLTTIGAEVTQADIDIAKNTAKNAVTSPEKTRLENLINQAQTQLTNNTTVKETEARNAVNALFSNNDPKSDAIKATTDQAAIDVAQGLVNSVSNQTIREELQKDLNKAQELLNARHAAELEEAANKSVKELFVNDTVASNAIKNATNQKAIDDAQKTIDIVTNGTVKDALQADLNKAQELLDARNAALEADKNQQVIADHLVKQLFVNNTPTSDAIKDATNQVKIDEAQEQVSLVKDPTVKATLQANLDRAQELLDLRNKTDQSAKQAEAEKAVNELFTNNNPETGTIKDTTTQKTIDDAQKLIDEVTDATKKAELQASLDKAQELLDAKNAAIQAEKDRQVAAEKAVNELFTSNNPAIDKIKETTTQKAIDDAQKLVNTVTDAAKKAELQKNLDRAQELLDAKNAAIQAEKDRQVAAEKAVNELFTSNKPATDKIKETTTQKAIDGAQKLVNTVTDTAKKAELQKNLDRAQELLDAKNATTGKITPNDFTIGTDKFITGSYTGDVAKVSIVRGFDEYTGATVKNGEFSFYTVGKAIKKTDQIYVVAYDKNGKELSRELVKFVVVTEGKITPVEMTIPGDNNITGTYTGDVSRIEVSVNDGEFKKGGTVANGTFKFYSYGLVTKATDKVVVKAYDSAGKLLDTKTVKIKTTIPTAGTVTVADYTLGTSNITGVFTGDVKSLKVTVGTTVYSGGTINGDGTFKFYILGKIAFVTDTVSIAAYDKTDKFLDSKVITVLPK